MIRQQEELRDILHRALDAISENRYEPIYDIRNGRRVAWHYERDIEKLNACCPSSDISEDDDYWGVVQDCLEAALENPSVSYKQPKNSKCSHHEALGLEMFAFVVKLPDFTRNIYTKFCLREKSDGQWYVSIDCHT